MITITIRLIMIVRSTTRSLAIVIQPEITIVTGITYV